MNKKEKYHELELLKEFGLLDEKEYQQAIRRVFGTHLFKDEYQEPIKLQKCRACGNNALGDLCSDCQERLFVNLPDPKEPGRIITIKRKTKLRFLKTGRRERKNYLDINEIL